MQAARAESRLQRDSRDVHRAAPSSDESHDRGDQLLERRVAPRDYTAALTRGGVPADFARLITYLFTELVDGRNAAVGDGVERALGRRPADFRDYARGCAARGVWPPRVRRLHRAGEAQERTVMIEA